MAIAHDTISKSHTGTTGSTSQASFSWSHTPVTLSVKGILIWVWTNSASDLVTSVTYGGINVPKDDSLIAVDTTGEPGRIQGYFLGSGIPSGAAPQTVVVNRVNNATVMSALCISVRAATAETEPYDGGVVTVEGDGTVVEQNVANGSTISGAVRYAAGHFGHQNLPTQGANSTLLHSLDIGATGFVAVRETVGGVGGRLVGMSSGVSDDRAVVHIAIDEKFTTEINGQALHLSQGSITTKISHNISGQLLHLAQGSLAFKWDQLIPTQLLHLAQGIPSITTGISISVNLIGQSLSLDQSPVVTTVLTPVSIVGQSLTLSQGSIVKEIGQSISGLQLTLSRGIPIAVVNTSLNLTGQALSLSQGSIVTVVSYNINGQPLTLSQGSISTRTDFSTTLTGQSLVLGLGSVSVNISGSTSQTINLTGQLLHLTQSPNIAHEVGAYTSSRLLSLSQGSISTIISPNPINLTGQLLHLNQGIVDSGSLTIIVNLTGQALHLTLSSTVVASFGPAISGQSLSLSQGVPTVNIPSGGLVSVSLIGQHLDITQSPNVVDLNDVLLSRQALTLSQGIPSVDTFGSNIIVSLTGQALHLAQGSVFPLSAQFTPPGRQLTLRQTFAITRVDITIEPDSLLLTLNQGSVIAQVSKVDLVGRFLLLSQGSISTSISTSVNLTGQVLTLTQGTLPLSTVSTPVNITGQQLTLNQNPLLGFGLSVFISGQQLSLNQEPILVQGSGFVSVFIAGQQLNLSQGPLQQVYDLTVELIGQPLLILNQGPIFITGTNFETIVLIDDQILLLNQGCVEVTIYDPDDDPNLLVLIGEDDVTESEFKFDSGVVIVLNRECME